MRSVVIVAICAVLVYYYCTPHQEASDILICSGGVPESAILSALFAHYGLRAACEDQLPGAEGHTNISRITLAGHSHYTVAVLKSFNDIRDDEFWRETAALSALFRANTSNVPVLMAFLPAPWRSVVASWRGPGLPLTSLLGHTPRNSLRHHTASATLSRYPPHTLIHALAKVLASTLGRRPLMEVLGDPQLSGALARSRDEDRERFLGDWEWSLDLLTQLGVATRIDRSALEAERDAVLSRVFDSAPLHRLSHGDVCSDNVVVHPANSQTIAPEISLVDWSKAGLRHALWDVVGPRLHFPSCWATAALPGHVVDSFENHIRHRLLTESVSQDGELRAVLSSTTSFHRELAVVSFPLLLATVVEYWDRAEAGQRCGPLHTPCRALLLSRLHQFLTLASPLGVMPHTVAAFGKLGVELTSRWGPQSRIQEFPAFSQPQENAVESCDATLLASYSRLSETCHDSLQVFGSRFGQVEVLSAGYDGDLLDKLRAADRPAVVRHIGREWSLVANWTSTSAVLLDTAVVAKIAELPPIASTPRSHRFPIGCCDSVQTSLRQFDALATDHVVYVSTRLPAGVNHALDDLAAPLTQIANDGINSKGRILNLWMSTSHTITPLHYDPFHNVFLQVAGTKRFVLFPPDSWQSLSVHPKIHLRHRQSQVNLNCMDEGAFPSVARLTPLVVVLEPGDLLYLPPFWFHQVETAGQTGSVSLSMFLPARSVQNAQLAWDVELPFEEVMPAARGCQRVPTLTLHLSALFHALVKLVTVTEPQLFFAKLLATRYSVLFPADKPQPGLRVVSVDDPHVSVYQREAATLATANPLEQCDPLRAVELFCPSGAPVPPLSDKWRERVGRIADILTSSQSATDLHLEDFIEDTAASAVGDNLVYHFLSKCLATGQSEFR